MAIINFVNTKASSPSALNRIINYVTQAEKTDEKLVSGKDVMAVSAYDEMMLVKEQFRKTDGRQYFHVVQSFSPEEKINHKIAHEIALKLADHYQGFQVIVATHIDKEHIHSHLIINSVNLETGLKIQQSYSQLVGVMDLSDRLCKEYGLSVLEHPQLGKRIDRNEYHVAMKGESWKVELINHIDKAMLQAETKAEFIQHMNAYGYGVTWQDSRKYITYTTPDGQKCRDIKLHDKKYTKEEMENGINARQIEKGEPSRGWRSSVYKASLNDIDTRSMESYDGINDKRDHSQIEHFAQRHKSKISAIRAAYKSKPNEHEQSGERLASHTWEQDRERVFKNNGIVDQSEGGIYKHQQVDKTCDNMRESLCSDADIVFGLLGLASTLKSETESQKPIKLNNHEHDIEI